ncbi:hypothetical protein A2852_01645 [Candidatus Adlerbacteria bacterium RIFCSPHIGHO2_01_FULL_54_23]|nr:MAG: hypothetical protein A2852_01645 [Candidatus Adlerbacteria bacterium RIFCSPHIGHO2_01_FULL_54_23]
MQEISRRISIRYTYFFPIWKNQRKRIEMYISKYVTEIGLVVYMSTFKCSLCNNTAVFVENIEIHRVAGENLSGKF